VTLPPHRERCDILHRRTAIVLLDRLHEAQNDSCGGRLQGPMIEDAMGWPRRRIASVLRRDLSGEARKAG